MKKAGENFIKNMPSENDYFNIFSLDGAPITCFFSGSCTENLFFKLAQPQPQPKKDETQFVRVVCLGCGKIIYFYREFNLWKSGC